MAETKRCFVDSNIWLYAFLVGQDPQKTAVAQSLLANNENHIVVSTQVINEVCNNLIRKAGFSETQIVQLVDSFYRRYTIVSFSQDIYTTASQLRERYSFSYFDSLICSATLLSDASMLYTEDMQHGLVVHEQLQLENPFH